MSSRTQTLALILIMLFGAGLSFLLFLNLQRFEDSNLKSIFARFAKDRTSAIKEEMEDNLRMLDALAAFYDGSQRVERAEFSEFVAHMFEHYSHELIMGWAQRVPSAERAAYESRVKAEGLPDFQIVEFDSRGRPVRSPERSEYFPLSYAEPLKKYEPFLGVDLGSLEGRRQVMEKARDRGTATALTAPAWIPATRNKPSYQVEIFKPVYRRGASPKTLKERRESLAGFVVQIFTVPDFVEFGLKRISPGGIEFTILRSGKLEDQELYTHHSRIQQKPLAPLAWFQKRQQSQLSSRTSIKFTGVLWGIVFRPSAGFLSNHLRWGSWLALLAGLLLSAFLGTYLYFTLTSSRKVEKLVEERTAALLREEEALRESENRYRLLFLSTNDAVWDWDLATGFVIWNDGLRTLFGYQDGEVENHVNWWRDHIHPEDKERIDKGLETFFAGKGQNWSDEYRFRCRDENYAIVIDRGHVMRDKEGKPVRMIGAIINVSERKKLENMLIQSEKMAALGQLAAGIAHEVNNPITAILGFSQNSLQLIQPGDSLEMPLQTIEREAQRCKTIVRDLLSFSRSGKTEKAEIDLNRTIESALSFIIAQTKVKNVELVKDFEPDLPKVLANKSQLQQVIVNLTNNAIDAMPKGGKLKISTHKISAKAQSGVEVQIQDTGEGMPAEVREKIFTPFFTTKGEGKGTGLGLSLVHSIVEQHHGRIRVESEAGKGTIFFIHLPHAR